MTIITTLNDIRNYVHNSNPVGILIEPEETIAAAIEAIRTADDRPAWGEDWEAWLDRRADGLALSVVDE